jgi:ubiquitin carboxyl-terminal hydrolase 34
VPTPEEDKAKKSVEEADPPSDADLETPPPAWRASLSPPTEDLFPGDQDMPDETVVEPKSDRPSPGITNDATPLADPTARFPYHETDKPVAETVNRLRQFLLDGQLLHVASQYHL